MLVNEPVNYTVANLADPGIDAATLGQVAAARPDLWAAILAHPNCYPELADWLRQRMPGADERPPAPESAETAAHRVTGGDRGSVPFEQVQSHQLASMEHQVARALRMLKERRGSLDPSVQQMSAGAKQLAAGAKDYVTNTVAPAAAGAAKSIQRAVNERAGQSPDRANRNTWVPFIGPAAAFIAIISLFLPIGSVSAFGYAISFNYFSEEVGGEGVMLLILMLTSIAFAVVSILTRKKWARIMAGIVGILVGLFGMIDGFGTMANISSLSGTSVGAGAVLLAITSSVLFAVAILTLLPQKRSQPAQAMQ